MVDARLGGAGKTCTQEIQSEVVKMIMKIYLGFNDIRQDGMGSAAMNLLQQVASPDPDQG